MKITILFLTCLSLNIPIFEGSSSSDWKATTASGDQIYLIEGVAQVQIRSVFSINFVSCVWELGSG